MSLMKKAKMLATVSAVTLGSVIGLTSLFNAVPQKAKADEGTDNGKDEGVVLTFSTVGDSRADAAQPGLSAQDKIWLQNTKAFTRITREVQKQNANLFLFNGDMIMGYTQNSDVNVLNRQYAYWRGLVANMFETGTYVVPVPGNHEVQDKYKDASGNTVKKATQANENTWRANMGDIIMDTERFKQIEGVDIQDWEVKNHPQIGTNNISTDQSQLSYSFDLKGSHFVIINTDPVGNDNHAPIEWMKQDMANAKKNGAKHIFVFGHKDAFPYVADPTTPPSADGLDADPASRDEFWKVIEDNNATYFCGHEHVFNVSKHGKAYQVLVGSGGSPFEVTTPTNNPTDRMYAWATVKVYKNGKVEVNCYGFDENYGKTKLIKSIDL
ncbi:metallophosphoesterase family protein [Neobacillus cucumis]|uniref:metallophosphoesterase family protein n=1 Tax=Neobacillus cucumis TaxID=1740721 RepID=UPI002E234508|nr:metallophosphoesterase [Neobacillus cucumis]MED4226494.1 metallophosphoesterase [Neobacillus cucumis]